MAASQRSELSADIDGKRSTKGAEKETRLPDLDNDFIITTRVKKGLKRWKFLQTEISRIQRKVAKGYLSKRLEPYRKERDWLVEQMQKDIPELQSIFFDEYSNAFDRKDKRRTTTGGMRNENRETLGLRSAESEINQLTSQLEKERKSKEEALSSLRSAESEINQLTSQLEKERKSKEESLSRLEAKNNQLINQLENERKANEDALVSLRSAECEINQLTSQLENERKSKEEVLVRLNRRLDESENEIVALKLSHQEEIGVHKEEIRKLQERLEILNNKEQLQRNHEAEVKRLNKQMLRYCFLNYINVSNALRKFICT